MSYCIVSGQPELGGDGDRPFPWRRLGGCRRGGPHSPVPLYLVAQALQAATRPGGSSGFRLDNEIQLADGSACRDRPCARRWSTSSTRA